MTKRTPSPIKIANKGLSNIFNDANPLEKQTGSDIWRLRGKFGSFITQDEKEGDIVIWPFPVNPILEKQASLYPFYLSISIILDPAENIRELNIKLFKEDLSLVTKADIKPTELLLRAEWVNEMEGNHAQPHWHIHSYTLIDELSSYSPEKQKSIRELLDDDSSMKSIETQLEEDIGDAVEIAQTVETQGFSKKELPVFKFHLSMLSDWDKEMSKSQSKNLDQNSLKTWLPQCLGYMKVQLEYILRKLPHI